MSFDTAYRELESRMRALAEADGDVYVPNAEPTGQANYVFVCMEPSLQGWARSPEDARAKVDAGFRNFLNGDIGPLILLFCIKQYLCGQGEQYHMTDLSKGAMPVKLANQDRTARWDRWYGLLLDEVDLVARPGARAFAVGKPVEAYLRQRAFPLPRTYLLHYSGAGRAHRSAVIAGREDAFEQFRMSISSDLVLATADEVFSTSLPPALRDQALARVAGTRLSNSDIQLIFNYKLAFESPGTQLGRASTAPASEPARADAPGPSPGIPNDGARPARRRALATIFGRWRRDHPIEVTPPASHLPTPAEQPASALTRGRPPASQWSTIGSDGAKAPCRYCGVEQPVDADHWFLHKASGQFHVRPRCKSCEKAYRTGKR